MMDSFYIFPLLNKKFLLPQESREDQHTHCPRIGACIFDRVIKRKNKQKQLCPFEIGMILKLCTSAPPEAKPCLMHKEPFGVCGQSPKERFKPSSAWLFPMHNAYTALVKYKKQVVGLRKRVAWFQTGCKFYSPGMQTRPLHQAMSV